MPDNVKLEANSDQLRRRNRELIILNSIAAALNRSIDLNEALQAALAQVAQLLNLQTGWIWLLRQETSESYLAAAQNLPPALSENPARMEGHCYCLDTFRTGDMAGAANVNVVTCSRLKALAEGTDGLLYHASIPLYAGDKKLGVLNVASPDWRELSGDDLRLLHTVGDLLSIAVERARLYGQSARLGALEERNRLAREIHDTLAQGLTAVALQLESADAMLEIGADAEKLRKTVSQALVLTQANLEEARRSVLDLRAAPLEGLTLVEALEQLVQAKPGLPNVEVVLVIIGGGRPLPLRIEVGIYRIVQEALSNVGQHAGAGQVKITLETTPVQLRLEVKDDGRGFDPRKVTGDRYGLVGLNERAKLLGGQMQLESGEGKGTRLEIVVPLLD